MKNIIITGAAGGVGREIAKLLKEENLFLIDYNTDGLNELANKLKANAYVCDVANPIQVETTFKRIAEDAKTIDILINCAGVWSKGELTKQEYEPFKNINTLERIKQLIDTNTFGIVATIKSVVPYMQKQGGGQIININSQSGVMVEEFCPVYNASKNGSMAFSRAILNDLGKNNIKLTDVCPGLIKTNFYKNAKDPLPENVMECGLEPTDVANLVLYVINLPKEITIPCVEIKNMKNF